MITFLPVARIYRFILLWLLTCFSSNLLASFNDGDLLQASGSIYLIQGGKRFAVTKADGDKYGFTGEKVIRVSDEDLAAIPEFNGPDTFLKYDENLTGASSAEDLKNNFRVPPLETRPWVYWYFMEGNLSLEGITADLEAMRDAGIGGAIFLEVDIGVPRGPIKYMSLEWRQLFVHAVNEAKRLGIEIALGSGPGWCGTGGPWVKADQSMQHLVFSETSVTGRSNFDGVLPRPKPRLPFFGLATLTPELEKQWSSFYRDVAVLAFPKAAGDHRIADVSEKALYQRAPYTSAPGVRSFLPLPTEGKSLPAGASIMRNEVVDITSKMSSDGHLVWEVPPGEWTIMRFVRTSTGQTTRPAPALGLGFETDKFTSATIDDHFERFVGTLLKDVGPQREGKGGWNSLHFDSWEMGSQNWSERFREEFQQRRGYDLLPYLPAFAGKVVDTEDLTERFLWDLRQTAQELVIDNHVGRLKALAHKSGFGLSIEPYDMNPTADLNLGSVADVPMCEFWWRGFDSTYSVIEAASIAHTGGRKIVAAEAFTSDPGEDWQAYPTNVKSLGDWALCAGVNRIVVHRYQHQPWLDRWPGMRMGSYGVHWERTQTWWPMVSAYHTYLSRCQYLLREGQSVADILFLTGEGAPHVFRAPQSATIGNPPDRRGYNFDGCAPETLIANAKVVNGRIAFPGGTSYRLLVLPNLTTMTPKLLSKVGELVEAGALVVGSPPEGSPSLSGYPLADDEVRKGALKLWSAPRNRNGGQIIWGPEFATSITKQAPLLNPLVDAKWIWSGEDDSFLTAPLGVRRFQRTIELREGEELDTATIYLAADDAFTLTVNGREVGQGSNFNRIAKFDLGNVLHTGKNLIEIAVENSGIAPNPAGLIGVIRVALRGGSILSWHTDSAWSVMDRTDLTSIAVKELGVMGMAPWGGLELDPDVQNAQPLYPHYDELAKVLLSRGVSEDFEADGPIRYTHRTANGIEIYFVTNRKAEPVDVNCVFRVGKLDPELWHPVTGKQQKLREFVRHDGRTTVPLHFDASESYFIVFREPGEALEEEPADFKGAKTIQNIIGPWHLTFASKWSDPITVTFPQLEDWSKRPEEDIKYFSGMATYRKTFVTTSLKNSRSYIDLGVVKNMAKVRLNGSDLGVVWCAPWRVDVTDVLKLGANDLEITVANLWPNRLIGDAIFPEKKRTWTSQNPFKENSPLLESGLIGPVTLKAE